MSVLSFLAPLAILVESHVLDPRQEARAQALMREIRCVACENEPISQSGAAIADDMRNRVRAMIADGASDAEVRAWFSDRYGEIVLFRPESRGLSGLVLWSAPLAMLLAGGAIVLVQRGRKSDAKPVAPEDLTDDAA
ncbi:MAG: cytochrome c-type biogenesis protein [Pseudomonadota bacterium]